MLLIPIAALPANGIQFINEDDSRLLFSCGSEELPNALGAYSNENLFEL